MDETVIRLLFQFSTGQIHYGVNGRSLSGNGAWAEEDGSPHPCDAPGFMCMPVKPEQRFSIASRTATLPDCIRDSATAVEV